jgi:cellulose synthase/poly-beta-1,6-N-acetylglucosamine synthase-like glycosyltransferase
MRSDEKGVLFRLAIKVILLIVAIFIFINIVKIIISQSLFFVQSKFGDTIVWIIIGLFVLSQIVIFVVKFFKKRNQDNF